MNSKYAVFRRTPVAAAVAAVLGTTAIAGYVAPAHAQEVETELEEVKVTGSRILRRDLDATSPLVTVASETFESTGTVALEASLNKLPQFVPAVTQFLTTDVQGTAVNTVGASTLNLRGIGANRNLVLLDGRRAMPVNATLVVDINSIPSAAIKRVEVISGGASSVYGADAVGGVVNFILKNDFEGMEFDTQYGITELGDDQELRVSGLMGGNFADNRGNAMFGIEYFKRGDARTDERDFFTKGWADPTTSSVERLTQSNYLVAGNNRPDQAVVDTIFNQAGAGTVSNNTAFYFNDDGTVFTQNDPEGVYRYNGILDGRTRKIQTTTGNLFENQTNGLVSIPEDRYSLFGRADYDILDNLSMFIQGNFTKTHTESVLQFTPAFGGWSVLVPRDADHPVPDELAQLLDSRPDSAAPWQLQRNLDFLGPRGSINDAQTYQVLAGFNGALWFSDWTWDAYASHGNTEVSNELRGFASRERFRQVVTAPNYGRGFTFTGNPGAPGNNFAAPTVTCTSGLPIFGDFAVSQDCLDAIRADLQNVTKIDQNVAEANVQGAIVNLPAGELRGAFGIGWRENTFQYQPDILASTSSFNDGVIGLFPAGATVGSTEVKEAYAELLVPVLEGIPGVKRLNLELGYRFSDYDTAGNVDTYKALIDWSIVDAVRFRGGYQRANRAPNIGELFLPLTQAVGTSAFGDPCATNSLAPYGASATNNPNGFQAARNLCTQLMGAAAASTFYNPATQPIGNPNLNVTTTNQGNLNLESETADTLTAGFVFRPSFDMPLFSRLTASIDWYQIKIDDTIAQVSFDTTYRQCLDPALNAGLSTGNAFCQLISRDPNAGTPAQTITSFQNVGKLETSGIDFNLDWAADLADMGTSLPGTVGLNLATTYLDKFEFQEFPGAAVLDYSGTMGGLPGQQGGQYRFKTFTTVSYSVSGVAASLRWRHLPGARVSGFAQNPSTPLVGPSHYDVVDLVGSWELSQMYEVRFGVENVLDKDPEIISSNPTLNADGTPAPTFTTGQGVTNAGYYDVLGRRYFVGFKARF